MSRRALIVGIDEYDNVSSLDGCVADAEAMAVLLERHEDGSRNYDSRLLTSSGQRVTRGLLREQVTNLFSNFEGDVLFYFSGHGIPSDVGGYLMTQDAERGDFGLPMNELLILANRSKARSVLLILDCCFSGDLGNPPNLQGSSGIENQAQLRQGLTILAASRSTEAALEVGGHGVFTELVTGALDGGAADVRGYISAASVYAYVEQALGPWDQRPLYKSHADQLAAIRRVKPAVPDELLRQLPSLFPDPETKLTLDPSFEHTDKAANLENVAIFNTLKTFRNARLLVTEGDTDLYFAALESKAVRLTPLGKFYRRLADLGRV